jgi:hypothetical protein
MVVHLLQHVNSRVCNKVDSYLDEVDRRILKVEIVNIRLLSAFNLI